LKGRKNNEEKDRKIEEIREVLLKLCEIEEKELTILYQLARIYGLSIYYRDQIQKLEKEIEEMKKKLEAL
jgi:hypothetical protein